MLHLFLDQRLAAQGISGNYWNTLTLRGVENVQQMQGINVKGLVDIDSVEQDCIDLF